MRVALVGARVGYVHRGFESFTRGLFDLIRDDIDVVLFKGAGTASDREIVPPSLWMDHGILSRLPLSREQRMRWNERSYAAGMAPHLIRGRFDIVHFSEYDVGAALLRLRRACGLRFRLLFSNGAPAPPGLCQRFDFVQEVSLPRQLEAEAFGIPPERLRLVPYGIDTSRFRPASADVKAQLRRRHGIPAERTVVVCAAALKMHHKRIDHLLREMAMLDRSRFFLVVAGQITDETATLRRLADDVLGDGYRFLMLPHTDMHELYQLGDLFALPSLVEGLAIVILEAMATGLPVIVHDDPLFTWVIDTPDLSIDMRAPGELATRIRDLADDPQKRLLAGEYCRRRAATSFDWHHLKSEYLAMYDAAIAVNPR